MSTYSDFGIDDEKQTRNKVEAMTTNLTVITVTPLGNNPTTGILTFVNERGQPGTAKINLIDAFCPGERVEVELFDRRREGINVPETWAKRISPREGRPYPTPCLVRAAVDLVIHSTPPGLGVDFDQIRDVVKALEVAHVSH